MKLRQIFKFGVVGGSGALIGMAILYALTDLAGWYYIYSYIAAFVVSASNNYYWHSLWTFSTKQASIKGYAKYLALNSMTLTANLFMVYVLTEFVGLWYMLSALIVTIVVFLVNYTVSNKYVWSKKIVR